MKDFLQLPHTADLKIRVYGATKKELFKHAVQGMFQSIGPHAHGCTRVADRLICPDLPIKHIVEVESPDLESLLVDFLSQALWLSDVNNEAYLDAAVEELNGTYVRAVLKGVKVNGFDVVEIKAVTYHDLEIKQVDGLWQADIVFDI